MRKRLHGSGSLIVACVILALVILVPSLAFGEPVSFRGTSNEPQASSGPSSDEPQDSSTQPADLADQPLLDVAAQTVGTFSDFLGLSPSELETLLIKLTYVGEQDKPLSSRGLSSAPFDIIRFDPFLLSGLGYANDKFIVTCTASTSELASIISLLSGIPAVITPSFGGFVSLTLVATIGGSDTGYETVLSDSDTATAIVAIEAALPGNTECLNILSDLSTQLDLGIAP